jgi:predicted Zn finger-like uncharacterized protein
MPEQIRCPECDATLRVPDSLVGKAVKCPKCQTTFTAELEAPEERERIVREPARSSARRQRPAQEEEDEEEELPPEEEEEDEDRPRRRKRRRGRGRRLAEAEASLSGPAIALMIVGSLDIVLGVLNLLLPVLGVSLLAASGKGNAAGRSDLMANLVSGALSGILDICFGGVILAGAIQMKRVASYGFAMTACILAMLPCWNCCLLGLPFGIWGLVVLNKPEVKDAFSR